MAVGRNEQDSLSPFPHKPDQSFLGKTASLEGPVGYLCAKLIRNYLPVEQGVP